MPNRVPKHPHKVGFWQRTHPVFVLPETTPPPTASSPPSSSCSSLNCRTLVSFQPIVLLLPAIQGLLGDPRLANRLRPRDFYHLCLLRTATILLHRKPLPLQGKPSPSHVVDFAENSPSLCVSKWGTAHCTGPRVSGPISQNVSCELSRSSGTLVSQ